jgi:CheY-like chemotaxis protein
VSNVLLERPQPLVCIVEDRPESLRRRVELFEQLGCVAIGASSRDDALRELGATPLVDLLVTDIHMADDDHPDDKSGIDLARIVRERWIDLPIAGYSAKFAEDDLSPEERGAFDLSFPKGRQSLSELMTQVEACVALANQHRLRRAAERERELERLRNDVAASVPPAQVLRHFDADGSANLAVEDSLARAGYRLQLVPARPEQHVREPFAVWLVPGTVGWEAEVYGYPDLYGFGRTVGDAVDHLVELMSLLAHELRGASAAPAIARMAAFLDRTLAL